MSEQTARDPGSFRDPSGHVFHDGERVLRTVNPSAQADFDALWSRGVHRELAAAGLLIGSEPVEPDAALLARLRGARGETPARILAHPRVPFWTHPYEWTFGQLKEAALGHLDLQLAALELGATLSDATPYNMQTLDGRMRFADVLSLRPYREGEPWAGYNQFCRCFVMPLLLEAWRGVPCQPFLRAHLDGVPLAEGARLLPLSKRLFTLGGLLHVTLHAAQEQSHARQRLGAQVQRPVLPRARYRALLSELRVWLSGLASARPRTYWHDYASINTYESEARAAKQAFVARFVAAAGVRQVWDLGGNSGDYALAALDAGARHAVVLDGDLDALDVAYARARDGRPGLQPVVMDLSDPSPARGWAQQERAGLRERAGADAVLALALIHHLCISRNVPPQAFLDWLLALAPAGIVEFVPKSDAMVAGLLALREDVFHDYDEASFLAALGRRAEVLMQERVPGSDRLLIAYRRRS